MSSNIERPSRNEITNKTYRLVSSVDLMCVIVYHLVRGVIESYWYKTYAIYMKENLNSFCRSRELGSSKTTFSFNFAKFNSVLTCFFKVTHMTRPQNFRNTNLSLIKHPSKLKKNLWDRNLAENKKIKKMRKFAYFKRKMKGQNLCHIFLRIYEFSWNISQNNGRPHVSHVLL